MEIVVHSKNSVSTSFIRNSAISTGIPNLEVWCKKWSNWTSGFEVRQNILMLWGIRHHPKNSDCLWLRNLLFTSFLHALSSYSTHCRTLPPKNKIVYFNACAKWNILFWFSPLSLLHRCSWCKTLFRRILASQDQF